ncbi:hypothetical protein, partial [Lacrimispora saccharolytica]|uniref:Uncharacterized protein n=1 Tax=Lacrimispora saccharolytica (strain ATCC 35040 / DSM 2544 / NRCC 2533 / WM1) TaxID=610130 RepID=D9R1P2_LACSW
MGSGDGGIPGFLKGLLEGTEMIERLKWVNQFPYYAGMQGSLVRKEILR